MSEDQRPDRPDAGPSHDHDSIRQVALHDEEHGDETAMDVLVDFEQDGRTYALLTHPVPVVHVLTVEGDGEDEDGELELGEVEPDQLGDLRRHVNDAIKDWGVRLEERGPDLVLSAEIPEEAYDPDQVIELETEDGPEDFFLLSEIDTGGTVYWLVAPEIPPLFPVELAEGGARPLEDEELERLEQRFREELAAQGYASDETEIEDDGGVEVAGERPS